MYMFVCLTESETGNKRGGGGGRERTLYRLSVSVHACDHLSRRLDNLNWIRGGSDWLFPVNYTVL